MPFLLLGHQLVGRTMNFPRNAKIRTDWKNIFLFRRSGQDTAINLDNYKGHLLLVSIALADPAASTVCGVACTSARQPIAKTLLLRMTLN